MTTNARTSDHPRKSRLEVLARAMCRRGTAVYLKTVLPTRCLPMPESRDVDEYLYVVHGALDVWIDGAHTALRAGKSLELPRGRTRKVDNFSGRPAKVLIVTSPPPSVEVVRRERGRAVDCVSAVVTPGTLHVALW